MSDYLLRLHSAGETLSLCADGSKSILESLGSTHLSFDAPCGGRGVCGKCGVELKGLLRSVESGEIIACDGQVLACRYAPAGDLDIWFCEPPKPSIESGRVRIKGGGEGLGLAIDLGTSTIAAAVYELQSGECISELCEMNAQRKYGADVISRIEHCRRGGVEELIRCTVSQLGAIYDNSADIRRVSIVGNTVMQHLAAGLDPSSLAVPPFKAESLFGIYLSSPLWPKAQTYYAPCVSAYVGGDIPAGMLACGMDKLEGLWLYVDIGTNGEIAIGDRRGYTTCATAAGPAFEGAEISCGMTARSGAIDSIQTDGKDIFCHVIGEGRAEGICGSGLIDAAAVLLKLGLLTKSGRFVKSENAAAFRERFTELDGVRAFMLSEKVYITARDIRKLQLAKAAIRCGMDILLEGRRPDGMIIAGGFGKHIDTENAVYIGLIPRIPPEQIFQAGNAAAKGAAMLLEDGSAERLLALRDICSYVELSSSKQFSEGFVSYLDF